MKLDTKQASSSLRKDKFPSSKIKKIQAKETSSNNLLRKRWNLSNWKCKVQLRRKTWKNKRVTILLPRCLKSPHSKLNKLLSTRLTRTLSAQKACLL